MKHAVDFLLNICELGPNKTRQSGSLMYLIGYCLKPSAKCSLIGWQVAVGKVIRDGFMAKANAATFCQ